MSKQVNRIKVLLAEKQRNNKWLADTLGKGQATVSKWVTNSSQPSFETAIQIAEVLGVSLDELVKKDKQVEL